MLAHRSISHFSQKKASTQFWRILILKSCVSSAKRRCTLNSRQRFHYTYANGPWASINTHTRRRVWVPFRCILIGANSSLSLSPSVPTGCPSIPNVNLYVGKGFATATEEEIIEKRNICEQCAIWVEPHNWLLYIFSKRSTPLVMTSIVDWIRVRANVFEKFNAIVWQLLSIRFVASWIWMQSTQRACMRRHYLAAPCDFIVIHASTSSSVLVAGDRIYYRLRALQSLRPLSAGHEARRHTKVTPALCNAENSHIYFCSIHRRCHRHISR